MSTQKDPKLLKELYTVEGELNQEKSSLHKEVLRIEKTLRKVEDAIEDMEGEVGSSANKSKTEEFNFGNFFFTVILAVLLTLVLLS